MINAMCQTPKYVVTFEREYTNNGTVQALSQYLFYISCYLSLSSPDLRCTCSCRYTETKIDCPGENQQQFTWPTGAFCPVIKHMSFLQSQIDVTMEIELVSETLRGTAVGCGAML
jgi:hypothetical protein